MTVYAYVGCRTTQKRNARGKGIEIFTIDEITGEWTKCGGFPITPNPSYLCFDKAHEHLYTVHGDYSEATAFKVDKSDGGLFKLNTVSTGEMCIRDRPPAFPSLSSRRARQIQII